MVVWPTSAKGFYEIRSNVSPITLAQRSFTYQFPIDGQLRADTLPTSLRHWVNVGSMLGSPSAKGFYEIRSNVSPITLGQRSFTHQFPTDGQRQADPLPTSMRHWVNVGSMLGSPSANGCMADIGKRFL